MSDAGWDQAEERAINERFVEHFGIGYPVIFTEADATRGNWGVTGIPSVFVIGRDGNVVGHAVGAGDAAHERLIELIASAKGE